MPHRTLLIATDHHQALRLQLELLRFSEVVEVATSAGRGLSIAQSRPPDAIVIAGDFPELDGPTLRHLITTAPEMAHIPIMLLTGEDAVAGPPFEQQVGEAIT